MIEIVEVDYSLATGRGIATSRHMYHFQIVHTLSKGYIATYVFAFIFIKYNKT